MTNLKGILYNMILNGVDKIEEKNDNDLIKLM